MMQTLLTANEVINGGYFRPTPMNARFDALLIEPHIKFAFERHVMPILCEPFYNDLLSKRNPNMINYNPTCGNLQIAYQTSQCYEELFTRFLYGYCSLAVMYEALPFIAVQTGSNGLYLNNSEYSQNAGIDGVKFIQDTLMDRITRTKNLMIDFLCKNESCYKLFCREQCDCCDCGCDDESSKLKTNWGIQLY